MHIHTCTFTHILVHTYTHTHTQGLYAKAQAGEIPHFTGISDDSPYEAPDMKAGETHIPIDACARNVDESVEDIVKELKKRGFL